MRLSDLGTDVATLLAQFQSALIELDESVGSLYCYPSAGAQGWDLPSLTAYFGDGTQGEPGRTMTGTFRSPVAVHFSSSIFVQLTRNAVATGSLIMQGVIPDQTMLAAEGERAIQDAANLLKAAVVVWKNYQSVSAGQSFVIGAVESLGPAGGMTGVRVRLDFSLD